MLEQRLGARVELDAGSGGVFDVFLDGARIFSKLDEGGDFPDPEEIVRRIQSKSS